MMEMKNKWWITILTCIGLIALGAAILYFVLAYLLILWLVKFMMLTL